MAARSTSPQLDALGRSLALRHVLVSAMPPTGSRPALPAHPTARRASARMTASVTTRPFVDPDGNRIEAVTFPQE